MPPDPRRPALQSAIEVERKYKVHGLFRLPPVTGASPAVTVELTATYYDTADLRLARHGVTLRRRTGGSDAGWHLKLPTSGGVGHREELHVPLTAAAEGSPPAALSELVLGLTRGAALEPVAALQTERTIHELRSTDGRLLAELTDDTVSVLDEDRVAARFRELELETRDGEEAELDAVEEQLLAAGAVRGAFTSKAARALGPSAAAAPDVLPPASVGPQDPAGEAVRAHLATQVRAFLAQDVRVRRGEHDAVHQMRVAARRMRSGLKVFAPLVEPEWADPLRVELGWVAGVLGEVRDREVLIARFERDMALLDADDGRLAGPAVHRALDSGMTQASAAVAEAMRSERYLALLDTLVAAAREPALTDAAAASAGDALPPLVAKAWKRLARDAAALSHDQPDEQWHETRIAAKKARYAAEACAPVLGSEAKGLARQLARVTEVLGDHQDAVIAGDVLRDVAARPRTNGSTGFALGLLFELQRRSAEHCKDDFSGIWRQVSRRRWRRWLPS